MKSQKRDGRSARKATEEFAVWKREREREEIEETVDVETIKVLVH